jgi:hypothetical protein
MFDGKDQWFGLYLAFIQCTGETDSQKQDHTQTSVALGYATYQLKPSLLMND